MGVSFVQNSLINCVYPIRPRKNEHFITRSFQCSFCGSVYFFVVSFYISGRKMRFPESSQNSISEKSIFGQFEVIFLNVQILPRNGVVISGYYFKEKFFTEKMSSVVDLKKK